MFWKKKAPTLMKAMRMISGFMVFSRGMPADLMESSSRFSPRLPKTMREASSMANGSAMGIRLRAA